MKLEIRQSLLHLKCYRNILSHFNVYTMFSYVRLHHTMICIRYTNNIHKKDLRSYSMLKLFPYAAAYSALLREASGCAML